MHACITVWKQVEKEREAQEGLEALNAQDLEAQLFAGSDGDEEAQTKRAGMLYTQQVLQILEHLHINACGI